MAFGILLHSGGEKTPSSLLLFLAVGNCIQTLINDGTCRGIRIKAPLMLPRTVAKEGGADGGVCDRVCGIKFDFLFFFSPKRFQ